MKLRSRRCGLQRKCVASTADYRLLDFGELEVRNGCVATSGEPISIEGRAPSSTASSVQS